MILINVNKNSFAYTKIYDIDNYKNICITFVCEGGKEAKYYPKDYIDKFRFSRDSQ